MWHRALALIAIVVVGCGRSPSHPGARAAGEYPGLAFVPADATYALASTRIDQTVPVVVDLVDAVGILADGEDARSAGAALAEGLGFDPLALDQLIDQGVDPTRGLAVWAGRELGPTLALPLADAERMAGRIEAMRGSGAVVQVGQIDGHEVSTWRPDREVALHWSIVGDWLLVHFELTAAREVDGAWLRTALATGGRFADSPDVAAARAAGQAQLGVAPAVIGVARIPAIMAAPLGRELARCQATLGRVERVLVAATSDGAVARGAVVLEVPGGTAPLAALELPAPPGWVAARGAPPLAVELALDLRPVQAALAPCVGDDLTRDAVAGGVFGGRAWATRLDLDDRDVVAAVAVRVDPARVSELTDEIPGFDLLAHERTVAGHRVTEVDVPMLPAVAFTLDGEALIGTVGAAIDPLLTGAATPAGELARIEVRPLLWSADQWDTLLTGPIGRDHARARTVAALRRWQLGLIEAHREARAIVVTARGERAR